MCFDFSEKQHWDLTHCPGPLEMYNQAGRIKIRMVFVPKFLAIFGAWVLERIFSLLGKTPIVTAQNIRSSSTDRVFDVSKAKKELGYKQKISIEEGLKKTVQYFKSVGYL